MKRSVWFVLLLALTACAPEVQKQRHVEVFPAKVGPTNFYAADGVYLPLRKWLPKGKPKAVMLALHGFNDYSRAFEDTGVYFAKRGVAVYAYDQRGFGQTPYTGVWAGEENLISDMRQALRQLALTHPKTPLYVLGESMGGAVAIAGLTAEDVHPIPPVKGLILSAPGLWAREQMSPLYQFALWAMVNTIPKSEFTGSDLKILASNNIPMLRRLGADPLIIKRTRVDAVYGVVNLMDTAYHRIPQIKTPTLFLYGARDQVINPDASNASLARFSQPIQYAYYPDGFHMLLRDLQAQEVMADILSWMNHPKRSLPSGLGKEYEPKK